MARASECLTRVGHMETADLQELEGHHRDCVVAEAPLPAHPEETVLQSQSRVTPVPRRTAISSNFDTGINTLTVQCIRICALSHMQLNIHGTGVGNRTKPISYDAHQATLRSDIAL